MPYALEDVAARAGPASQQLSGQSRQPDRVRVSPREAQRSHGRAFTQQAEHSRDGSGSIPIAGQRSSRDQRQRWDRDTDEHSAPLDGLRRHNNRACDG